MELMAALGPWNELFMYGTVWFWGLVLIEICLLCLFVEIEHGIGATFSLVVFATILYFLGQVDFITYIKDHPLHILGMLGLFFLIGTLWGIGKWWMYVRDRLEDYEDHKAEWLERKGRKGLKVVPDDLKKAWKDEIENQNRYSSASKMKITAAAPSVRDHKAKIMRWMAFWPVSMIWSVINDLVKRIFKSIYYHVAVSLQKISDRLYKSTAADFVDEEAERIRKNKEQS